MSSMTSLTVVGERAVVGEGDDHIEHGDAVSKSVQTAEVFAQVVQQLRHNSTHVMSELRQAKHKRML